MIKKKWIVGFLIITIGVIAVQLWRIWNGHADMAAGNIAYTYNCAWVDWKHARPGGIKTFVDEFSDEFAQTPLNETFKITYEQQGGFRRSGYSFYTYSISKEYEVLKLSNDDITKKKLMFQIFKDVSYLFENQQKEILWGTLRLSSFREGDLMGNLIGFYIACGEITQEEASELCGELPISISLQLKKDNKFEANDSFIPKYRIITDDKPPVFPTQLTRYNHIENFEKYIIPLDKTEKITFFNKDIS